MTGPEHYREGERLLAEAKKAHPFGIEAEHIPAYALLVAQADAHFAAAQAAAVALTGAVAAAVLDEQPDVDDWIKVAGVKPV